MKQVYEKRKLSPNSNCPWHGSPVRKTEAKTCRAGEKGKPSQFRFFPLKRSSKDVVPSPMLSPSTIPTLERDTSMQSNDRVFTFEDSGRSFIKKSLESTVYKGQDTYQTQLVYMQQYITHLKSKLSEYEQQAPGRSEFNQSLQEEIDYLKSIIQDKNQESNNYLDELCEKQDQIFKLTQRLSDIQEYSQENYEKSVRKNEEATSVERELKSFYSKKIAEYENALEELKKEVEVKEREISFIKCESRNSVRELENIKEKALDKVEKEIDHNHAVFNTIHEKVAKAEDKLYSLTKSVRFLQNSALLPSNSKLRQLEEEITSHYEKLLQEQKTATEKLKENLKEKQNEYQGLEESYVKVQKLLEKYENDLKKEVKANQEYAVVKAELEKDLERARLVFENEKIERILKERQVEELKKNLELNEKTLEALQAEAQSLRARLSATEDTAHRKGNEITEKLAEIFHLKSAVEGQKGKSQQRKSLLQEKSRKIEDLHEGHIQLQGGLKDLTQELKARQVQIESLKLVDVERLKKISLLDKELIEKTIEVEEANEKVRDLQAKLIKETQETHSLLSKTSEQSGQIYQLQSQGKQLELLLAKQESALQESYARNSETLVDLDKYKKALHETKQNLHKLEVIIQNQNTNFELLSQSKKSAEKELKDSRLSVKFLESAQGETSKTLSEFQSKVKELNQYIQQQEGTIESLQEKIQKMDEDHEASLSLLNQHKLSSLKETASKYDKEKEVHLEKIQKLEDFCLELNKENSEKHEKILDLVNEFKDFKGRVAENEVNMARGQIMLSEEVNYLRNLESKLRKEVYATQNINAELIGQSRRLEDEIVRVSQEKNELLELLQEKETNFVLNVQKSEQTYDQFEKVVQKNSQVIAELELSKKQLIDKLAAAQAAGLKHEEEFSAQLCGLQEEIKALQGKIAEKSSLVQEKESKLVQSESRLASEIQRLSEKLQEKESEISNLNLFIIDKETQEKGLKSVINELKLKQFENERLVYKANSDIESLKEKIQDRSRAESSLNEKLKITEEKFHNSLETIENLNEKISQIELSMHESKDNYSAKIRGIVKELERSENSVLESDTKAQNLLKELESLENELLASKQGKIEAELVFQGKLQEMAQEVQALQGKLNSLNSQNFDMLKLNSELKGKLASAEVKLEGLGGELRASEDKARKAAHKAEEDKNETEKIITEYEGKIEKLRLSHKQARDALNSEVSQTASDLKHKAAHCEGLLQEISELRKNEEAFKRELADLASAQDKKLLLLKAQLEYKDLEIEKLEKTVAEVGGKIINFYQNKSSEETFSKTLKALSQESEDRIKGLAEKVTENESVIRHLQSEQEGLLSQLKTMQSEVDSEASMKKHLEMSLEQKKKEAKVLAESLAEVKEVFENEVFALESKLIAEKQRNEKFVRELSKKHEECEEQLEATASYKEKLQETETYLHKINMILNEEKVKNRILEKRMETEIEILNKEKDQITELMEKTCKELESNLDKHESLKQDRQGLEKVMEKALRESKVAKENLGKVEKVKDNLIGKLEKYKVNNLRLMEEIRGLNEKVKQQGRAISEKQREESISKSNLDELEEKAKTQDVLIKKLRADSGTLERRVIELQAESDQLVYTKERVSSLENQLANLDSLNSELRQECCLLNQEKLSIQDRLGKSLAESERQNDCLSNSLKALEFQSEFQEKMQKHAELKSSNLINQLHSELEHKSRSFDDLLKTYNQLTFKYEDLLSSFPEQDHETLKALYRSIKSSGKSILDCDPGKIDSEASKLKQSLDLARLEVTCLKNENSMLKEKMGSLVTEHAKNEDFQNRQLRVCEEELAILKIKHEETTKAVGKVTRKNEDLERAERELQDRLRGLAEDKAGLTQKFEVLSDNFRQMTSDKDKLIIQFTEENSNLKSKLAQLKSDLSQAKTQYAEQLSDKSHQVQVQSCELDHLKQELSKLLHEQAGQAALLESTTSELSILKQKSSKKLQKLTQSLSSTTDSLQTHQSLLSSLRQTLQKLEQENLSLAGDNDQFKLLIEQLQKEKAGLEALLEEFRRILRESGAFDINELREMVIELQTQKILDGYKIEKDGFTIKRLEEESQQKLNNYKINVLQHEVQEKERKIEKVQEEHRKVLASKHELINKLLQGIAEVESVSISMLSSDFSLPTFKDSVKKVLKIIEKTR